MGGSFAYRHGDKPLEGYTILRGIGRGGFGEVYYAVSDGGREVALKVLHQNQDVELRGVRHCINLKSPHLISIFDVKKNDEGAPFVIMEYVAGQSLRDLLREAGGGLEAARAAFLVREIGKGLSYLHERGIVHRDLKPENIFYEDGYVKIGDYGLSKYISVSRQSGQTISVGTVHYMAPEIGSGNYHRGIDLYALGIILYELLTGTVPFNGDSMGEILMKHLTCEPDVSELDPRFHKAVLKALAKKPEERYGSVQEMIGDVFADPELAEQAARFQTQSLTSGVPLAVPIPDAMPLRQTPRPPVIDPAPAAVQPPPAVPAAAPQVAPEPAGTTRPAVPAGPAAEDLRRRLVIAALTAGAMALGLGLFTGGSRFMILGYGLLITIGSAAVLLVEHWIVPRFAVAPGIQRRIVTFAVGGPVLTLAMLSLAIPGSIPALLAGLVIIDWSYRAQAARKEKVSLGEALLAGVTGFVCASITGGNQLFSAGILAAMSLVVNVAAPTAPAALARLIERVSSRRPAPVAGAGAPGNGVPAGPAGGAGPAVTPDSPTLHAATPASPAPAGKAPQGRRAAVPPPLNVPATLARPFHGGVIAGVCAGIARRYGWDAVWVRLAFVVVTLLNGLGLLAYIIFWASMPQEPAPGSQLVPPRMPAPARPRSSVVRGFWYVFSVLFLTGAALAAAVPLLIYPGQYPGVNSLHPGEQALAYSLGAGFIGLAAFSFLKASPRQRLPFLRGTLGPFLLSALLTGAAICAIVVWKGDLHGDERGVLIIAIIACGIPAVFLAAWMGASRTAEEEQVLLQAAGEPAGLRTRSPTARAFWGIAAVIFLTSAVVFFSMGMLIFTANGPNVWTAHRDERVASMVAGTIALALSGFCFFKARVRRKSTFLRGTAAPFLLMILALAAGLAGILLKIASLRGDERAIAIIILVACGVPAVFLGAWMAATRRPEEAEPLPPELSAEFQSAWTTLGFIAFGAAFLTALGGALMEAGVAEQMMREAGFQPSGEWIRLSHEGWHLVIALVLFLPAVLCFLFARRMGGIAHVLRGAFGWLGTGTLLGLAFSQSPELIRGGGGSGLPGLNLATLVIFLVLGTASVACLAWPGRAGGRESRRLAG